MNLLIDCSYIGEGWNKSDSILLYATRLIQGLKKYSQVHVVVLTWKDKENFIDDMVGCRVDKIVIERKELTTSWRPYYRLTGFLPKKIKEEIKSRKITDVLLPFHCEVLFFYPHSIRHYAIAHDMLIYDMNQREKSSVKYYLWSKYQNFLTRKFTRLISISCATHDEILSKTGIDSDIVYNSIPFDFQKSEECVEAVSGLSYILDVNRYDQRKNPETLIRALFLLRNKIPHILYLKGEGDNGGFAGLRELVKELGMQQRVIFDMKYRTEGEMRYLYTHADLFVSPSLKEGFGWTPVEAAILKTPVLVSDIDVFREVTCGKLSTFDPHSPEDLAQHILDMLSNPPSMEKRTEISEFFLETYSLKRQVHQLVQILERGSV